MGKKTDIKTSIQNNKKIEAHKWDFIYIEKKHKESSLYVYLNLEIKKFIKKFLKNNNLVLNDYKINFLGSDLKIFISYFKSSKIKLLVYESQKKFKSKIIQNKKKIIRYFQKKKLINFFFEFYRKVEFLKIYYNKIFKKRIKLNNKFINLLLKFNQIDHTLKINNFKILISLIKNRLKNDNPKIYLSKLKYCTRYFYNKFFFIKTFKYFFYNLKLKKIFKRFYKKNKNYFSKKYIIKNNFKVNSFLEKLIESLNIFFNFKFNIKITLHQINKNLFYALTFHQLQSIKNIIMQLRQFSDSNFFLEGINLIFLIVRKKNSSKLLSQFISLQFKSKKKHNIFFRFLKRILSLLFVNKLSKIKSIKILIKGRFNRSPRTKKKKIFIGKHMPLMSFNSNINYSKSTAYGPNGTFGIKVWVNE